MYLGFTKEQDMLRESARKFLQRRSPMDAVRRIMDNPAGYDLEVWLEMADLGWMGLSLPEAYGGLGMSLVDLSVIIEEMGRNLLPSPFFPTVVFFGLTVADSGTEQQKHELLPGIASGEKIGTLALLEPAADWSASGVQLTAKELSEGFVLNGVKLFVPYGHVADYFLCAGRTDARGKEGITLFLVDARSPGIETTPLKAMDQTTRLCEVAFHDAVVAKDQVIGDVGGGWPILERELERASALLAAEIVGGAEAVLHMCVDYAKTRIQFGQPIGSFQAVKHKCADMAVSLESSQSAAYYATRAVSENAPDASLAASIAKAHCCESYTKIAGDAIQVHGGMGFTWQHDLHLYFKRAKLSEIMLGDATFHRERIALKLNF